MESLRSRLIRLAHSKPELRAYILPMVSPRVVSAASAAGVDVFTYYVDQDGSRIEVTGEGAAAISRLFRKTSDWAKTIPGVEVSWETSTHFVVTYDKIRATEVQAAFAASGPILKLYYLKSTTYPYRVYKGKFQKVKTPLLKDSGGGLSTERSYHRRGDV